jgi:hypothetical protein
VATDQAVLPKNDFGKALRFWYPQRQIMNAPLLKQNCKLVVVLGALFLVPGLSIAGVIGSLPYTITTSGNYELETNLTYAGHGNAIEVNADDVVINLNGFSISTNGMAAFGVYVAQHKNLTVQNGSILGFQAAVVLAGPQSRAVSLQLVKNVFGVQVFAKDCAVQDCFIVGTGPETEGNGIELLKSASGVLVKGNQVSEFVVGLISSVSSGSASAFIGNYVANSGYGLALSRNDFYQGNVVTNCTVPFTGGNAIGTENGGN